MYTTYPLRKIGPRIFISYSFRDYELATQLSEYLSDLGFQIRMENDTSLLGENLREVLPKRIGDAEVVMLLLTPIANASTWVQQEYHWAVEQKKQNENLLILPIVLDSKTLFDAVKDRVYIDASLSGLSDDILRLIANSCLKAVELLPLDQDSIFHFRRERIADLLNNTSSQKKRIVVDSDGTLCTLLDEILNSAQESNDPLAEVFINQQKKHQAGVVRRLFLIDQVIPVLIEKLQASFQGYGIEFPERAIEAVNRLSRYEIGLELLQISHLLLPEKSKVLPAILDQLNIAKKWIEEAQRENLGKGDLGEMIWVLGGTQSARQLQEWVQIGFDPEGDKQSAIMYFPANKLGQDWQVILSMGERPDNIILAHDWADFCIPQLAISVVNLMYSSWPFDEVISSIGWEKSEYRSMGFS